MSHRVFQSTIALVGFGAAFLACSSPTPSQTTPVATNPLSQTASIQTTASVPFADAGTFSTPPWFGGDAGANNTTSTPIPVPSSPIVIPSDYVHIPGGWTHPSCIHTVPNGSHIDQDANGTSTITVNGNVVQSYPDCGHTPIPMQPGVAAVKPAQTATFGNSHIRPQCASGESGCVVDGNEWSGWVEGTEQLLPDLQGWGIYESYAYLPAPPPSPTEPAPTLGYWGAWESSTCSGILQPVVSIGTSAAGGWANEWSTSVWFWSNPGQFTEGSSHAYTGDHITNLIEIDPSNDEVYVEIWDDTQGTWWWLSINNGSCSWDQLFPAVMEVAGPNPPYMSSCNQIPQSPDYIDFFNILLYDNNYNEQAYNPSNFVFANAAGAPLDTCGFAVWSGNFGSGFGYGSTLWQ